MIALADVVRPHRIPSEALFVTRHAHDRGFELVIDTQREGKSLGHAADAELNPLHDVQGADPQLGYPVGPLLLCLRYHHTHSLLSRLPFVSVIKHCEKLASDLLQRRRERLSCTVAFVCTTRHWGGWLGAGSSNIIAAPRLIWARLAFAAVAISLPSSTLAAAIALAVEEHTLPR
jgi:hypothetical protein